MPDVLPRDAYREHLHALLPRGPAWPRDAGTVLDALLGALAAAYGAVDDRAVALLSDLRPDTTTTLLPDWERLLALPDKCTPAAASFDGRRRAVVDKVATPVNLAARAYLDVARTFGYYDAEVIELLQPAAEAAARLHGLDAANGRWRYIWWLALNDAGQEVEYFDTLSDVDEALASADSTAEVICRILDVAPAHTYPIVNWIGPHPRPPGDLAARWIALPRRPAFLALTWTPASQTWATGYEYRLRQAGTAAWGEWTAVPGGGGPRPSIRRLWRPARDTISRSGPRGRAVSARATSTGLSFRTPPVRALPQGRSRCRRVRRVEAVRRIYKSGSVPQPPGPPPGGEGGYPTEGDVLAGVPATVPGRFWFHQITEELEHVIRAAGLEPSELDLEQLRKAIQRLAPDAPGGLTGPADAKNANYAATLADDGKTIEVDASGGPITVTLPNLEAANDGYTLTVLKVDSSANAVTVDGDAGDTINGAQTYDLEDQHEAVLLKWNGSLWLAIGGATTAWARRRGGSASGGLTGPADAKNANYVATLADDGKTIEVDASGGPRTVTLPNLEAANDGYTLTVLKVDSSANAVTVDGDAGDTINGAQTYALGSRYESAILKWTGALWLAIGGASTGWLRGFFGNASRRVFTAAGVHNYDWEWEAEKGLLIIQAGGGRLGGDRREALDFTAGVGFNRSVGAAAGTLWLVGGRSAVAYDAATGARKAALDLANPGVATNFVSIATHGNRVWLRDDNRTTWYAYSALTGARDAGGDIVGAPGLQVGNSFSSFGDIGWYATAGEARRYNAATLRGGSDIDSALLPGGYSVDAVYVNADFLWLFSASAKTALAVDPTGARRLGLVDIGLPEMTNIRAAAGGSGVIWVLNALTRRLVAIGETRYGGRSSVQAGAEMWSKDGDAGSGGCLVQPISGMSKGDRLAITVGAGAPAGAVHVLPVY